MKPLFRKISAPQEKPYVLLHEIRPRFKNIWHYHPELQLHYILRGEGVRFIGDNVSNFSHGELVLVGENLPHTWRSSDAYFDDSQEKDVEVIVMQFLPDCLGSELLKLSEAHLIPKLFEKAKSGMLINGETKKTIVKILESALGASGLESILVLFTILKVLAETDEYETIVNGSNVFHQSNTLYASRLNDVCNYTLSNYKNDIDLEHIADLSNLSVTSFCRYFKLMTNKTFHDFLTEIRISHACRALVEDKFSATEICFECGFNNISNFYRHFKKITGTTPREYKQKYLNT